MLILGPEWRQARTGARVSMGLGSPGVEMLGTFLVMVMVVLLVVVALEGVAVAAA